MFCLVILFPTVPDAQRARRTLSECRLSSFTLKGDFCSIQSIKEPDPALGRHFTGVYMTIRTPALETRRGIPMMHPDDHATVTAAVDGHNGIIVLIEAAPSE